MSASLKTTASYLVSVGGLNVADASVDLSDDGQRYAISLHADVSGIGQMLASGTADAATLGRSHADGLSPESFKLTTVAKGDNFEARVGFTGGDATEFVVTPPILDTMGRVPIERAHLHGVTDVLSAFAIKGGALDRSLCERKVQVFTGVERFDLQMSYAKDDRATSTRTGYQGPLVLCRIRYLPVSGHFTTSEMTSYLAREDRILIWYAPLRDSEYFIPYRVLVGTSLGDLSVVLTAVEGG